MCMISFILRWKGQDLYLIYLLMAPRTFLECKRLPIIEWMSGWLYTIISLPEVLLIIIFCTKCCTPIVSFNPYNPPAKYCCFPIVHTRKPQVQGSDRLTNLSKVIWLINDRSAFSSGKMGPTAWSYNHHLTAENKTWTKMVLSDHRHILWATQPASFFLKNFNS